ncbi:hypothetical protein ANCDUO_06196 [Ancylostoma duodenale]|uniref:Uncharacterized protein n=1 Tax=Ancylostoma duodenale TaxID=51022 RepID=A0A0C2H267_9BILA|nr:hypothetical protein ANCDUO_06196 [Ancylostoma duodenale]
MDLHLSTEAIPFDDSIEMDPIPPKRLISVGPVIQMRVVFPLISSFLSYVNPWMMILTTQDLRRKILDIYGLREKRCNGSSNRIASIKIVRNQSLPLETVRRSTTIRHQG